MDNTSALQFNNYEIRSSHQWLSTLPYFPHWHARFDSCFPCKQDPLHTGLPLLHNLLHLCHMVLQKCSSHCLPCNQFLLSLTKYLFSVKCFFKLLISCLPLSGQYSLKLVLRFLSCWLSGIASLLALPPRIPPVGVTLERNWELETMLMAKTRISKAVCFMLVQ